MATDQQLIDKVAANDAVKLTGGALPTFTVNRTDLESIFLPEQDLLRQQGQPTRTIKGNMTLNPPNGAPVVIPTIIMIGRNGQQQFMGPMVPGSGAGGVLDGATVTLNEPNLSGNILIAIGGRAGLRPSPNGTVLSNGGDATVNAKDENLIAAIGGESGRSPTMILAGGKGGDGTANVGQGNDIYVYGGRGGDGPTGAGGAAGPAATGCLAPAGPGVAGGAGGVPGPGGDVTINASAPTFVDYYAGDGGVGGAGGPGGPGGPGYTWTFAGHTICSQPVGPVGSQGPGRKGGTGGNVTLGIKGKAIVDPTSSPGHGGGGGAGVPTGRPGDNGK